MCFDFALTLVVVKGFKTFDVAYLVPIDKIRKNVVDDFLHVFPARLINECRRLSDTQTTEVVRTLLNAPKFCIRAEEEAIALFVFYSVEESRARRARR